MNSDSVSKPSDRTLDFDIVAVDWLLAVRKVGLAEANRIEDYRLKIEWATGQPCSYAEATEADAQDRDEAKAAAGERDYARAILRDDYHDRLDPRDANEPHSVLDLDGEGVGL